MFGRIEFRQKHARTSATRTTMWSELGFSIDRGMIHVEYYVEYVMHNIHNMHNIMDTEA